MTTDGSAIRLWTPTSSDIEGAAGDGMVACLASAFSSGPWASTPMPVGDADDSHSARGIVAGLGSRAQVVLASAADDDRRILGCVMGGIMDERMIGGYGLARYGARAGDGLLAYIGVAPRNQGIRVARTGEEIYTVRPKSHFAGHDSEASLAGLLFKRWLELSPVTASPSVFVRTRRVLKPILHLSERNGFDHCGQFDLTFQGSRQERIVFRRENRKTLH